MALASLRRSGSLPGDQVHTHLLDSVAVAWLFLKHMPATAVIYSYFPSPRELAYGWLYNHWRHQTPRPRLTTCRISHLAASQAESGYSLTRTLLTWEEPLGLDWFSWIPISLEETIDWRHTLWDLHSPWSSSHQLKRWSQRHSTPSSGGSIPSWEIELASANHTS